MHCHRSFRAEAATSGVLVVLVSVSLLLALTADHAQARYLPTRADVSDVEILKDLIRGLIMQSNTEQLETKLGRFHQVDNRLGASQAYRVERRSMEIPQSSVGDSLIRSSGSSGLSTD